MRHFIVLGFASNSKTDPGKSLYLGGDRDEALKVVNGQSKGVARRELYELAIPQVRRHFELATGKMPVGK